ncbi:MAG: iron-containing alcohol dehydrogenase [Eubacterium sp.]|nr:iron-containing alcohol dehydrogenase [Eubacterium sp.]
MNCLKKVYCRVFQICFRAALPLLPYTEPKILEGMDKIPKVLEKFNYNKVLIVTDKGITEVGLGKQLTDTLEKADISYEYYDNTVANPTVSNVEEAKDKYIEGGCQAIVALGGGSSMDCAKAAGARVAKPNQPVSKMKGILKIHKKIPLLLAIPTTAGTGSETTLAAVITDEETHHKYPINDFPLIPKYAVLDYKVTTSLPQHLTATTGMDALTHAVEAYIGRSTTRYTRKKAVRAVKLIGKNLKRAYDDGNDAKSRMNMLKASYCAGVAFTQSYVGYVHGVAHSLGGQYGVPHGLANAVILPYVLEMYGEACYKKLAKLAVKANIIEDKKNDEETAKAFIHWIKDMNQSMNIPDYIEGIEEKDIPKMAKHADKESNPLYPVPKLMNAKELEEVYYKVKKR